MTVGKRLDQTTSVHQEITGGEHNIAGRDIVIQHPSPQRAKSLAECTADELIAERSYRRALIGEARRRIYSHVSFRAMLISGAILFIWPAFAKHPGERFFPLMLALVGLPLMYWAPIARMENAFIARQRAVLYEIEMLLRQRGVE